MSTRWILSSHGSDPGTTTRRTMNIRTRLVMMSCRLYLHVCGHVMDSGFQGRMICRIIHEIIDFFSCGISFAVSEHSFHPASAAELSVVFALSVVGTWSIVTAWHSLRGVNIVLQTATWTEPVHLLSSLSPSFVGYQHPHYRTSARSDISRKTFNFAKDAIRRPLQRC